MILECVGHPGYSVSDNGDVYSHRRKIGLGRGGGKGSRVIIDTTYFKKLKPSIGFGGYPQVYLWDRQYHIHRLVAETFIPNPLNKPQVNHIDFNICNPCVSNLEWVTPSENSIHSVKNGRMGGEKSNRAKLSAQSILKIRELIDQGIDKKKIASMFGICDRYINQIKKREVWKYI